MRKFVIITLTLALLAYSSEALAISDREQEILDIEAEAESLDVDYTPPPTTPIHPTMDELISKYGLTRDVEREESLGKPLMDKIYADYLFTYESILRQEGAYDALLFLITYDFGTTAFLGAGERAGSISSWRASRLARSEGVYVPSGTTHWEDILKIANGRWPSEVLRDETYENTIVADRFRSVFLRDPDRSNPNDDAAIMIMGYGLRPEPRNLESERTAIGFFKGIYGNDPMSAADWDIVRAIAYSGATR